MITPTRGKIMVEILREEEISPAGIIFVKTLKEIPHYGLVIAVGIPALDKRGREIRVCCRPDDKVFFKKQYLTFAEIDGKKVVFLKNEDVLGIER